ncbi:alkaline phosphatase family protein [Fontibacillus sp. BL9]|uniref:alkaline phosphatase family protein n=1 Tax=Fontibacillus sp. BL9 TaxID=3389971 RepID=UPI00397D6EC9
MWKLKWFRILSLILLWTLVAGCQHAKPKEEDLLRVKSVNREHNKKVILLVADSLMSQTIDYGMRQNELPTLRYLIEHGQYYKDLVSAFPTMSVSIDSTLLTGQYPDGHRIPGLTWYNQAERKTVNYGTGPLEVLQQGIDPVLADAVIHLNSTHLNPKLSTIYEDLAKNGLKSGSINGLIYRGSADHTLSVPGWIHGPSSLPKQIHVKGPDLLALGMLSNPFEEFIDMPTGLGNKMGINNDYSMKALKYLIRNEKLPDFLYVYLPDLDQELHKNGPSALKGVKELDGQLYSLLQSFGSPEQALQEVVLVIMGDSGMTQILPANQNPEIDLPSILGDERVLSPGEADSKDKKFTLAVNETMAYVYAIDEKTSLKEAVTLLHQDSRIDFIAWQDKEWVYAIQGSASKQLKFKAGGTLTDPYKQTWTLEGDLKVLDVRVNDSDHTLSYGGYPDVLKRLSSAMNSHGGRFLVVTAKPGYELSDKSSPTHKGGGGHGSIRSTESLVPLIICGSDQKPQFLRIVDLKTYFLDLLTTKNQYNE